MGYWARTKKNRPWQNKTNRLQLSFPEQTFLLPAKSLGRPVQGHNALCIQYFPFCICPPVSCLLPVHALTGVLSLCRLDKVLFRRKSDRPRQDNQTMSLWLINRMTRWKQQHRGHRDQHSSLQSHRETAGRGGANRTSS